MKEKKRNVAILFGGCSSEYEVSLQSVCGVLRNLDREKYEPLLIGISREGDWFHYTGDIGNIAKDTWLDSGCCTPAAFSPSRSHPGLLCGQELLDIDVAFPVLHGRNGEDGTVQGLFALAGIPLAGCNILSSALCMDKERAHKLVGAAGIRVPRSLVLHNAPEAADARYFADRICFPLFVKPVKAGSSLGITKVFTEDSLGKAIENAFQYDDEVLLEENIEGFEVGCAVLGTDRLMTGEVDEIELSQGFFDFTEKYTLKTSAIHVPARISPAKAGEIKKTAGLIYQILGCSGFARVDMFLTPSGEIVFNEVNTIPGFTEHSRYPGMMKAAGLSLGQVLDQIIEQAGKDKK